MNSQSSGTMFQTALPFTPHPQSKLFPQLYHRHRIASICPEDLFHLLHTQQIVRQKCFFKKRVPARRNAVRVPEIEAVGESGADLMVFAYHKAVLVPFRVCKADVLGAAKQVHVDIHADALQHSVGFFLYLKKEQDAFSAGEQEKKSAQGKKVHIPFLKEENKPNKEAAAPGQKGQEQPPK